MIDPERGCPTDVVLHACGGYLDISAMEMGGHQLKRSPEGQLRPVGLAALAGSGQEMETYSHLAGVHWELLSPAVGAARGTGAKAIQHLEGRAGVNRIS